MSDPGDVARLAAELLHFHPKWFEYEFLPLEFFDEQLQKLRRVEEHRLKGETLWDDSEAVKDMFWGSLEHHRYVAFRLFLDSHNQLSDEQVKRYVELCELDEDKQGIAQSALIALAGFGGLTATQREFLLAHPACNHKVLKPFFETLRSK